MSGVGGILQAGSGILAQSQHARNLENCEIDKQMSLNPRNTGIYRQGRMDPAEAKRRILEEVEIYETRHRRRSITSLQTGFR